MKRNENFMMREAGGIPFLVPLGSEVLDRNGIVVMNETGRYLWGVLESDRSTDELAIALSAEYAISVDRARTEVQAFVDELRNLGLVGI